MDLRSLTAAGWLSPLSLAAYVAWTAVWLSFGHVVAADPLRGWLARGCALLFLAGFVLENRLGPRLDERRFALLALLLAAAALAPVGLAPYVPSPILLVLLAAVLASRYEGLRLWLWLLGINLAMAALMQLAWRREDALWVSVLAYGSFQLFAALVIRYAAQAERAGAALQAANAELLATRALLADSVRDGERLRMARELHDVAGHKLTALTLNLRALAAEPAFAQREEVRAAQQLAQELLGDIRGIVHAMRDARGLDLATALRALAAPWPRPRLVLQVADDVRVTDPATVEAVLRVVQEALTNSARHADADEVRVRLFRDGERLALEIEDDGRLHGPLREGHGLAGMRERVAALGGSLDFARTAQGALRIIARLGTAS